MKDFRKEVDRLDAYEKFVRKMDGVTNVKDLLHFLKTEINYKKAKSMNDIYE